MENEMSMERYKEIQTVINNTIRKYGYRAGDTDKEDIAQNLWVAILEKEEEIGGPVDIALAYKICANKIRDMGRYEDRRDYVSIDKEVQSGTGNNDALGDIMVPKGSGDDSDYEYEVIDGVTPSGFKNTEDANSEINIDGLLNKFPKDSKEYKYVEWYLNSIDFLDTIEAPEETRKNSGWNENTLAKSLGFPSGSSSSYRTFRRKVNQEIADYFTSVGYGDYVDWLRNDDDKRYGDNTESSL